MEEVDFGEVVENVVAVVLVVLSGDVVLRVVPFKSKYNLSRTNRAHLHMLASLH